MTLPWNSCRFDQASAQTVSGAHAYAGPGDVATFKHWYGLRAYSAAKAATAPYPGINVVKASDGSAAMDINILTTGALDIATIAGLGYAVRIAKVYDQVASADLAGFSAFGNYPDYSTTGGPNNGIQAKFVRANSDVMFVNAGDGGQAQPWSMNVVATRTGNTTSQQGIMTDAISGFGIIFPGSINAAFGFAGSVLTYGSSVPDNAWHSISFSANSTSSKVLVDSGSVTTGDANTGAASSFITLGSFDITSQFLDGGWVEGGLAAGDISSNFAALHSQQQAYWGPF